MILSTTKQAVFSILPTFRATRVRSRPRVTARPTKLPCNVSAESDTHLLGDVCSIVLLCVMAGVMLCGACWSVRVFVEELTRNSNWDLLRGIAGM